MARRNDDDLDFLGGGGDGPDMGDRAIGALLMLVGTAIFSTSFLIMFNKTTDGLASHNMHTFLTTFALVLIIGMPFFVGGIWLFKKGMRTWKGKQ